MSQDYLKKLFSDAFGQLAHDRPVPDMDIRFYPYSSSKHTIRRRAGRVYVRLSDIFKNAPPDVHRALAFILVAKLLAKRTPEVHERIYRDYACSPQILRDEDIARRNKGRKIAPSARGRVYDLDRMFVRLNRRFFDGKLQKPPLAWSQRSTRSILGHHAANDTIVINKMLDADDIPDWFVEYVLYHEMLHIKHPSRIIKGRRYYHTNAFRIEEQRFPYYQEAQDLWDQLAHQRHVPSARAA